MRSKTQTLQKAANIKCAIFDVDGVLTDGRLYFSDAGETLKVMHVHDGLGLKLLQKSGVEVAIISSRRSTIVANRLKELGINHVYQGQENKQLPFQELLQKLQISPEQVAYVGDDLPDLPILQQVGLGICVANAHPFVKQFASWQTEATGGNGAVREICELIMEAQGTLRKAYEPYILSSAKTAITS